MSWKIVGIAITAGWMVWVQVPGLIKKRYWKDLVWFSLLLLLAVGVAIARSIGPVLSNPLDWIMFVFRPISDWMFGSSYGG